MSILAEIAALAAAAVLTFTAVAKVWAALRHELVWPSGPNFGPYHLPLWAVVMVEVLGILAYVILRNVTLMLLVLGVIFLGISFGAATLRGRPCGCFGIVNPNVGWWHIAGTSVFAAVCLLLAAVGGGIERLLTVVQSTSLIIGLVVATSLFLEVVHHRRNVSLPEATAVEGVVVVTSESCSACRALKRLEGDQKDHSNVRWVDSEDMAIADELRAVGDKHGYPMAVPVLNDGLELGSAVFGIGPVRALIARSRKSAEV